MHLVWHIQLPKRQRIGLLVIFGAGFLYVLPLSASLVYKMNRVIFLGFDCP